MNDSLPKGFERWNREAFHDMITNLSPDERDIVLGQGHRPADILESRIAALKSRRPLDADPIREMSGNYEIETRDIDEGFTSRYHLTGKLSVSKINEGEYTRKKYFIAGPIVPKTRKIVEWRVELAADGVDRQLYHTENLANAVAGDLEQRGIGVNPQEIRGVLDAALRKYVNRALHFCVDRSRSGLFGYYDRGTGLIRTE